MLMGQLVQCRTGRLRYMRSPHGKGPGRLAFRGGVELSQMLHALAVHNWFPRAGGLLGDEGNASGMGWRVCGVVTVQGSES